MTIDSLTAKRDELQQRYAELSKQAQEIQVELHRLEGEHRFVVSAIETITKEPDNAPDRTTQKHRNRDLN